MTRQEACRVLGISGILNQEQIKKRYHQLLHLVHPDTAAFRDHETIEYPYDIHEITTAYSVLSGSPPEEDDWIKENPDARDMWDAKVQESAFCEREILQHVEDYDGSVIGVFTLARGKYIWTPDEEFPLFMQSIMRVVTKLISQVEDEEVFWAGNDPYGFADGFSGNPESNRRSLQLDREKTQLREKLTYLLTQQFIDARETLGQLVQSKENADHTETIFQIPAMLEREHFYPEIEAGETLYPAKVRDHRLFVKNEAGDILGYLSFADDRMYYLVIPLFEQRRVQVKLKAIDGEPDEDIWRTRRRRGNQQVKLNLWLKFKEAQNSGTLEDSNGQIKWLLDEYREILR